MFSKETVVREVNGQEVRQNVFFGVGRLTANPPAILEVGADKKKVLRGNKEVNFSMAFDKGKDSAEFYRIEVWGDLAEALAKLGFKGQPLAIIGYISTNEYEGKTYETLVINRFQVLKYKDKDQNANQAGETSSTQATSEPVPVGATEVSQPSGSDDDIPF